ncbi:conserved hypothetical protein [Cupriavidus taiwanensis]|nr:conserved hypothetical protein [Cupriavidus taiwanensis]
MGPEQLLAAGIESRAPNQRRNPKIRAVLAGCCSRSRPLGRRTQGRTATNRGAGNAPQGRAIAFHEPGCPQSMGRFVGPPAPWLPLADRQQLPSGMAHGYEHMIDADKRSLLTDALTPPPGCHFDSGVATTYSLDLVTLLALPLHLSWLASGEERPEQVDPIRMVEALRRTADRLTVFCERGRMLTPRMPTPLLGLLEGMVHEATAPHSGAFHPKVWVLRFVSSDKAQAHLRLLVMSRNLTNDASWDLCLQLDGMPLKKKLPANRPLAEFIELVVAQSCKTITANRGTLLSALADEVRRCDWDLPPGFDEVRFHTLGLGRRPLPWLPKHPEHQWDELGVISPFAGAAALESLQQSTNSASFLVSRPEELDALPEPLPPGDFSAVMVLDERAEFGDEEDDAPGKLRGLHAKVYVARRAWNTHVFIGSANATDAALVHGCNVEFMAELIGKHTKVGRPESWLGEKGLQHMLRPYERSPLLVTDASLAARERLANLHRTLSKLPLEIECAAEDENWALRLSGLHGLDISEVCIAVWPLTLSSEGAVSLTSNHGDAPLVIGVVGKQEITSFTGFLLKIGDEELRFGLEVPLRNAPAGRDLEILRLILRNRDGFVRYLVLLLGEWLPDSGGNEDAMIGGRGWWGIAQADEMPLFEMLARAYAREPERLVKIAEVVERLKREGSADADGLIPPAFLSIWENFEAAMRREGTL